MGGSVLHTSTAVALAATTLAVMLAGSPSPASAEDAADVAPLGYVGARMLYARSDFDIDLGAFGAGAKVDAGDGFGFGLLGGWRFDRWAALELELDYVPDIPIRLVQPVDQHIGDAWVLTLIPALRGFPFVDLLPDAVSPSVLFGTGMLITEGSVDIGTRHGSAMAATLALHFAGTLDVRVTRNVFLSLEGGYTLAPIALSVDRFSLAPNVVLVGAGVRFEF